MQSPAQAASGCWCGTSSLLWLKPGILESETLDIGMASLQSLSIGQSPVTISPGWTDTSCPQILLPLYFRKKPACLLIIMCPHGDSPGFPFCTVACNYLKTSLLCPAPSSPEAISSPCSGGQVSTDVTDVLTLFPALAGLDSVPTLGRGCLFGVSAHSAHTRFLATKTSGICLKTSA